MPKKFQNTKSRPEQEIRVETVKSSWLDTNRLRQIRHISGLLLLTIAILLLIAMVGYFSTGAEDYSLLHMSRAARVAERVKFQNMLGLPGAWLASMLIDGTVGWFAFLYVVWLAFFGSRLLHLHRQKWVRSLICSVFAILWGAVAVSLIQIELELTSFYRWGGAYGHLVAQWGLSYVHLTGMVVIMLSALLLFCVAIDVHFAEHVMMVWTKIASHFRKSDAPAESDAETPESTDSDAVEPIELEVPLMSDDKKEETTNEDTTDSGFELQIVGQDSEETPKEPEPETAEPVATEPIDGVDDELPEDEFEPEVGDPTELNEEDPDYILKTQGPYDPRKDLENYQFPSANILKVYDNETQPVVDKDEQQSNANRIVSTLRNYGVEIESIKATVGPTVTLYEIVPKAGTRVATIQRLENDIMLALSAEGIRIIAPMPGKGTVGIEVPNEKPQVVSMHSVIAAKRFSDEQKMRLPVAIGKTITNEIFMFDLAKTPHLLVAGATGQGKSVGLNAIITSLLYKKHPAELKFVMVDPKMVEFTIYKPLLRHYMAAMPDQEDDDIIITDCQKVINTLNSLVIEMEDRYALLADASCRNVEDYNEKFMKRRLNPTKDVRHRATGKILHHHYLPYLVIIIDEYGDFIMQAGKEVEMPISRITQKARAVGMHMILATQRPSVNIVTGIIKANIPTRIAFRTQSAIDSKTVLDATGANQLIGKGDMLYSAGGNITRIQCAFVDTPEVEQIVGHVSQQQRYLEPYQLPEYVGAEAETETLAPGSVDLRHLDPLFNDIARYVVSKQEGSTSKLQRAFEIGYNRAGKLTDQLEAAGIVGPNKGSKGRDVLIQDMETLETLLARLAGN